MATYVPGESTYSNTTSTRDYKKAYKTQMRAREKYALQQQSLAQEEELRRHASRLKELDGMMGKALNNPDELQKVRAMYYAENQQHKNSMAATKDISQYYEGFGRQEQQKPEQKPEQEQQKPEQEQQKPEQKPEQEPEQEQQKSEQKPEQEQQKPEQKPEQEQQEQQKPEQDEGDSRSSRLATGEMANYFFNKLMGGSRQAPNAEHLRQQATMHDIQAGDEQKAVQQNMQIANRNYMVESEKKAAANAAQQNAQKVHNLGNASAGAAALERDVASADYNTDMPRSDAQRAEGVRNMREAWGSRQTAEEERADSDKENHDYADMVAYNNMSDMLSRGGSSDTGDARSKQKPEQKPAASGENEAPEASEDKPGQETPDKGNLHVLLNYIEGSTKDSDKYNTPAIRALIHKYGVQPLKPEESPYSEYRASPKKADALVKERYPAFKRDYDAATGRHLGDDDQINAKTASDIQRFVDSSYVESDPEQRSTQQNINSALASKRY